VRLVLLLWLSCMAVSATAAEIEQSVELATKHARYVPASWSALPGWEQDANDGTLATFVRSCQALRHKSVWSEACNRADDWLKNPAWSTRQFFESTFDLYQVRSASADSDQGLLTGYFEPLVRGSLTRTARFNVPIHATPRDLLLLDRAQLGRFASGETVDVRIDGRSIGVSRSDLTREPPIGVHRLNFALTGDAPTTLDRKLRVRISGSALIPYPSRADIVRMAHIDADVLGWVESAEALYLMQVQGCGRLLLPDGRELQIAYAEQNGQVFSPREGASIAAKGVGPGRPDTKVGQPASDEVLRIIEALEQSARGRGSQSPIAAAGRIPRKDAREPEQTRAAIGEVAAARDLGSLSSAAANDPSYVFFRRVPSLGDGPIGALGVALTPGRSVAVDPRTSPLGAPVFVSSTSEGGATLNRLVIAQDTGGAIRGAVRADYFWGAGHAAGQKAFQTKQPLRLWLLLPKGAAEAIRAVSSWRSKGVGPPNGGECLISDEEFCVE
jgi:membrane-bound lytic murein transglycosylase A